MDSIKKKMAALREKLEAAEERARKSEDELHCTNVKADEVIFLPNLFFLFFFILLIFCYKPLYFCLIC